MIKMKYILITFFLLAGCSQQSPVPNNVAPSRPASQAEPTIPADVQTAITMLLGDRPYPDEAAVQKAAQLLHSFEESVPGVVETLVDQQGHYSTAVTHSFPKVGISISYHDGKVIGASRIQKKTETSNKSLQRTR
jgi:hypothetical protein